MPAARTVRPHAPAAARGVRLTDFDQLAAFFSHWQGRFEQLTAGRFEASLRVVRGRTVRAVAVAANQSVLLRGRDAADLCSFYPVITGNAGCVWQGRRLRPGGLVVHGPDAESDHCSSRQMESMGLSLRAEVLAEAARVLRAADAPAAPRGWAVLTPPPDAAAGFHRRLQLLIARGTADPALLATPEGHRLEQECVRELVAALHPTGPAPRLPLPARADLIRRGEEFMRARLGDPVGAIDLCAELGVSDRTLRLAFREKYSLGPMAYYKCLRLNAVRARLKADPLPAVAAVAREFGFHHLGNFAADYRRLFGERPSATPRS